MKIDKRLIKVLLIEDNRGDQLLLREMLSESKRELFKVICAVRLEEGIALANKEDMNIVLVDLGLPDSQGIETFDRMSAAKPDLPVIVMTGLNDEDIATEAMRKGAQDYIVKGDVNGNLLIRALRYAIERKQLELDREKLIVELQDALAKIKTLRGLIPICSFCKKIRDDQGYWQQIEEYVRDHADVNFSHSICPACAKDQYPELYDEEPKTDK